jgi:TRAP-type C4-dicarboxylate transport system permease small subunit
VKRVAENKINRIIDGILFYLTAVTLATLVGICFAQVLARYIFKASFSWAEEVSIILLLWGTWGGACLAVKQRTHLRVSIILDKVTQRTNQTLRLTFSCMAIIFLAGVALTGKLVLNAITNMALSSLPEVPISIMYISVPVGCILMIYYFLRLIVSDLKEIQTKPQEEG